jgi:hypothetical protein
MTSGGTEYGLSSKHQQYLPSVLGLLLVSGSIKMKFSTSLREKRGEGLLVREAMWNLYAVSMWQAYGLYLLY